MPSDPSLGREENVPPATPSGLSTTPAVRSTFSSIQELKPSAIERIARFIAERPALVIGGASAVTTALLLGAAVFVAASSGPNTDAGPSASSSSAALESTRAAAPVAASETAPPAEAAAGAAPAPSPSSSLGEASPLPTQLELAANQPIAHVRVGKRVVDIEVPAPVVAIDLTAAESRSRVSVLATAEDGRSASATWTAGDPTVRLTFGDAPPAPAAGKPRSKKAKPKPKPKPKKP